MSKAIAVHRFCIPIPEPLSGLRLPRMFSLRGVNFLAASKARNAVTIVDCNDCRAEQK
ncbi:hypothetical protein [Microvirga sp. KLBC 81]|uniref:hypothetical protein n=1 Tax=Microvirga sp. KLBC 81 TaxID=1862707 RepID=UPI0014037346|nr:hypothetical protein [Microvirga sp. KLBC 81]